MVRSGSEVEEQVLLSIGELQRGAGIEANSRLVFERFYPWVRRYFSRLGYSPADCEDLAQDVFTQVFRRLDSFRGEHNFRSWLFAVAANVHRNEGRKWRREKRRSPEVSLDEARLGRGPEGVPWEPAAPGITPPRALFERERTIALDRAIAELPPQMRQVLRLRIVRELKVRDIATVLQISAETVKSHLFQARERLRRELGEEYGAWSDPEPD